eukprot:Gregarina_sp_Poly_1__8133@NODE_46_length_17826_cov_295_961822_g40_i0_p7_GENE_NODE_46_length_17826_cov_295_961822_g40_i0NODE_46_length_17826_cov_295_961822_g40_i0_p7_ORF_typecomplete_len202_score7_48BPD_transp_2/PF02653_16/0_046DUF2070/PF09843_9/1_4HisKA_7TM/PF16927_5/13DUF4896/PF16237_5/0_99DUF4896/PF16237_5/7_1e02AA_permease_2/PF13520_6/9_1Ndc1_Nup/PF09531_10/11_NODE_46_length_17826_cov_295_961822_g40_i052105815
MSKQQMSPSEYETAAPLLWSAVATSLLLAALVLVPDRNLSLAINFVCLAMCIGFAAISSCLHRVCLQTPQRPQMIMLTLCSSVTILCLWVRSFYMLFSGNQPQMSENPLSHFIQRATHLDFRWFRLGAVCLLFAAWIASCRAFCFVRYCRNASSRQCRFRVAATLTQCWKCSQTPSPDLDASDIELLTQYQEQGDSEDHCC